jgi:fucose permease
MGYFAIPTAAVGFFISSWLTMVFWGIIAPDFDIKTIGYPMAMLLTIALWLVVAPLAASAAARSRRHHWH